MCTLVLLCAQESTCHGRMQPSGMGGGRICLIDDLTGCCLLLGPIRSPLLAQCEGGGEGAVRFKPAEYYLTNISKVTGDRAFRRGEGGRSNLSPPPCVRPCMCLVSVHVLYLPPSQISVLHGPALWVTTWLTRTHELDFATDETQMSLIIISAIETLEHYCLYFRVYCGSNNDSLIPCAFLNLFIHYDF